MGMSHPTGSTRDEADRDARASFGFRHVPLESKQRLVDQVFATVAGRYDLMNDLMSGGLHRLWKDDLVAWLNPPRSAAPFRLLDMASGTGDIVQRYCRVAGPNATAVAADISPQMLAGGRSRTDREGFSPRVSHVLANAEALPFGPKGFDAYTIAFGVRNVPRIERALAEAYRVLKPGGRFLCLEFSAVQVPMLDRLYDFHSFQVIPRLGKLAAGAAEPYEYLVESIRKFPRQEPFAAMIRSAGFARVGYRNLTGGIAAIHSGWRI